MDYLTQIDKWKFIAVNFKIDTVNDDCSFTKYNQMAVDYLIDKNCDPLVEKMVIVHKKNGFGFVWMSKELKDINYTFKDSDILTGMITLITEQLKTDGLNGHGTISAEL